MMYRIFVFLHRWAGLLMAAFLIVVGLTGSMLAFRSKLDALFNPSLHVSEPPGAQPLDLATLAERVEAIEPRVRAAYFAIEPGQALIAIAPKIDPATGTYYPIEKVGFDHMILDPYTGKELGRLKGEKVLHGGWNVMSFVYDLHTALAMGIPGYWTLAVVALVWTIDTFIAFYLTLPRGPGDFWMRWKNAWRVKWGANAFRLNFDLHRASGLWLWILVLAFAWSSVMLGPLRSVYTRVTSLALSMEDEENWMKEYMLPKPLENPRLGWREALALGQRYMAGQAAQHHFTITRPYGLSYIAPFGVYAYDVRTTADIRGHGWDTGVWVDGNTGALRKVFLAFSKHPGNTFSTILWGIHYGDLRDFLPFRILVCLFGGVLTLLSVTGILHLVEEMECPAAGAAPRGCERIGAERERLRAHDAGG